MDKNPSELQVRCVCAHVHLHVCVCVGGVCLRVAMVGLREGEVVRKVKT